jgi:hypothetical protein
MFDVRNLEKLQVHGAVTQQVPSAKELVDLIVNQNCTKS